MKTLSLAMYCAAGAVDLIGLLVLLRSLPTRLKALAQPLPPPPPTPMAYNESLTVVQQVLAARNAAMVDASVRRGFNELISALRAEAEVREASDQRLEKLTDLPRHRRDLLTTVVLVLLGALLGMAGNLLGPLS
ncbi:MAG TPA: hypothetical protein VHC43_09570 [Mycobacteriales bacterium]|nr:hypothetical protein [Mycobacteriales bacterium]